ncbi:DUF305 domain-containing protein [Microbacterium album]|uniref:Lipoprotein n=1 Tax=Microbacterium album TaxID=2053191 RepID=A0A917IDK6_9MICO|nr:DUF305 domain-containing protein [Microbacterium album]GGH36819.1 lipoprotein [Microbacterium album]
MSQDAAVPAEGRARRPWAVFVVATLLIAGAAFAAGRFSMFGAVGPGAPNAADMGFARDMQLHHAQAVEMAMIEYRDTDDDELRAIAYDIATAQSAQAGEMYGWLVHWGVPQASDQPLMAWMSGSDHDHGAPADGEQLTDEELREAMGMASPAELTALREATGTEQDCLFTELMIRHHTGAIEMVRAVQELGSDPRVTQVASGMAEAQQREIEGLQAVHDRLACG